MDENGHLIDGDHMLAILADALHQQHKLLANTLVTTVMANGSLHQYAAEHNFELIQTPVGDKYVSDALLALTAESDPEGKLGLGGEQSGHIILLDKSHRTGDGLRTAVFMLQVLLQQEQPFSGCARLPDPKISSAGGFLQCGLQVGPADHGSFCRQSWMRSNTVYLDWCSSTRAIRARSPNIA